MVSSIVAASLMGLSSFALISAAPTSGRFARSSVAPAPAPAPSSAPASSGSATNPFSFPLANGFPDIANPSSQLTAIEEQALGTLPNGPPPASVTADTLTSLELIAFNELFEVAYFTDLIYNITNDVPGYQIPGDGVRQFVLNALTAVQAQEELHALNANGALQHFGAQPIQPCTYQFPVTTFDDAIALASTFTDVVLGTLQDVQSKLGSDGDFGLIRGVGSVIGQEGEQNGYYRTLLNKVPSALPFLTTSTREFAFSALNQNFVVPGSCPNIGEINLPIFEPLTVVTSPIAPQTQNLQFSFVANNPAEVGDYSALSLVYINQQNLPVVEPLQSISTSGSTVSFEAAFPYDQFEMNGLTIAAVVQGCGPFASADAVAAATLFGPGLIEIN